jgi:hypothetical protein
MQTPLQITIRHMAHSHALTTRVCSVTRGKATSMAVDKH